VLIGQDGQGERLQWPTGLLLDDEDNLWVSDAASGRLMRFPALDLPSPEQPAGP
jgi:hypothetical protein